MTEQNKGWCHGCNPDNCMGCQVPEQPQPQPQPPIGNSIMANDKAVTTLAKLAFLARSNKLPEKYLSAGFIVDMECIAEQLLVNNELLTTMLKALDEARGALAFYASGAHLKDPTDEAYKAGADYVPFADTATLDHATGIVESGACAAAAMSRIENIIVDCYEH